MKISFRAFIGATAASGWLALRVVAQDVPASPTPQTNSSPVVAAPSAGKTATAEPKKASARPKTKKAEAQVEPKLEPVVQPEAGVSKQSNVNVRGQASINSEVIGRLQKNEPITILEAVTLKKPKQDEPARWYRISLPTNVTVWVNTGFIDEAAKTVKPRRLNMRGGPGENYSILGRLERGTAVNPIETKGDWTRIETPTNAFGFVAAHLVERTPAPAIVAAPKTPELVTPVVTNPPPQIAEVTPAPAPAAPANPVTTPTPTPAAPEAPATPAVTPAPAEALPDTAIEKVKKVVSREGVLKGSVSIQAPTYYELRSLDTGKTIDYVFSPSTNLVLKQFKGRRIIVTGEELLDERWQNTPVLVVDALQTVP
jgi:uncharacterized protein YgiM (DUF1202 family)